MMENAVLDCLMTRRSVKAYRPDAVPEDRLNRILEAGLYAASGLNRQGTIILCITDRALRDRLSRMNAAILGRAGSDPFYGAPCVMVVLAERECSTGIYDGSLVLGNMMIAAHAEGLGSCWIHRAKEEFDSAEGKSILHRLGVTGDYVGVGHLIVGYPAGEEPQAKPRREGRIFRA